MLIFLVYNFKILHLEIIYCFTIIYFYFYINRNKMELNKHLITLLKVLAWAAIIVFSIKALGTLHYYFESIYANSAAVNKFMDLDLSALFKTNFTAYSFLIIVKFSYYSMQIVISFIGLKTLLNLNMENPFTKKTSDYLLKLSNALLGLFFIAFINNGLIKFIKNKYEITYESISTDFMLFGTIAYLLAQIFIKGVALQTDKDLTI